MKVRQNESMPTLSDAFLKELETYIQGCVQEEVAKQLSQADSPKIVDDPRVAELFKRSEEIAAITENGSDDATNFMQNNGIKRASSILERVMQRRGR